ncbi:EamA family transporter [Nocardioides lentus]|uniref:EamA family transporter n=1 Tax=Nocardioides lentus TaxID=338077 RepID=A0ABN2PJS7_9ACTN
MTTLRPAPSTDAPARRRGVVLALTAGASNQTGAAIGAHAFDAIGPGGVVAVRQVVAASVLLPTVRPPVRRFTWAQWWPVLLLGLAFGGMNLGLYTAVDRLGLGLAVTLEFLGPLTVALLGSRRAVDLACAALAAAGVYALVLPSGSTDLLGVGAGLAAAACWAAYILLNRLVGRRLPGLQATASAAGVSAVVYLPVAASLLLGGHVAWQPVALAAVAGLLSSVVPYALDLTALRLVPARAFGVLMSAHPVLAALAGLLLLGQALAAHELVGIALVVVANVVAMATAARPRR